MPTNMPVKDHCVIDRDVARPRAMAGIAGKLVSIANGASAARAPRKSVRWKERMTSLGGCIRSRLSEATRQVDIGSGQWVFESVSRAANAEARARSPAGP